jgi:hypothetical protein
MNIKNKMEKVKNQLSREQLIEAARASYIEIPTTTRVKAWTFQALKKNYVIVSFRNLLDYIEVYPSTRAGRKTTNEPIVRLKNCNDPKAGFERALDILIPEETQESAETNC